ncbi:YeeE/YedE thiosulfate transporter family protein [Guyparkeria halophila]|uniref:YeeE/YedE thiosulfate transporter family protein n=1 Tax=Guyparkeria halophila TaxID=47960 RepID=A0ABZ0YV73_9GAMM|nr:YeeE/YedE thiosulfate transporter family protein [Guyparkeria halophila]WQH16075.1 YeeE/YedE thiosulfate transporter family protein [Guyparkeria halophila]
MSCQVRPLWPPFIAGIVLGLVVLLTFVLVGNGMGSSGAFARVATEVGLQVAPEATRENAYLGGMAQGNPLAAWIVVAAIGTLIGAILAAVSSGRFRVKVDRGSGRIGVAPRLLLALGGGLLAGFGSRLAAGCTSGVGLSNTAMLGVAGFVFLIVFFVVGILISLLMRRVW